MKEFNKRSHQTMGFETTLEVARAANWSMERTMAEYRVTMYIEMDLESADKTLALNELQEIKDKENPEVFDTISRTVNMLCREYPSIYEALENDVTPGIKGNAFYREMYVRLKREYREIWKEL